MVLNSFMILKFIHNYRYIITFFLMVKNVSIYISCGISYSNCGVLCGSNTVFLIVWAVLFIEVFDIIIGNILLSTCLIVRLTSLLL